MIITIDGPAGAGKSTVAKELARQLGFLYLDTGAMYRALTLKVLEAGLTPDREKRIVDLAKNTVLDIREEEDRLAVYLDGKEVTAQIRDREVTNNVHWVCRIRGVRERMKELQRKIGLSQNIVVEGRDIGTVVFPQAEHKFYLDASLEERSRRRWAEEKTKGTNSTLEEIRDEVNQRDARDKSREIAPLRKAPDAMYMDTTHLSISEVVEKIKSEVKGG